MVSVSGWFLIASGITRAWCPLRPLHTSTCEPRTRGQSRPFVGPGYFLDPLAPGWITVGRDPHTFARYRLWCLAFRAACTGFDTRWPRSAPPCPVTAITKASRVWLLGAVAYTSPPHWYSVPHVGYRQSLPLVSEYFFESLAPGSILVGRDLHTGRSALPLEPGLILVGRDLQTLAPYRLWCMAISSSRMRRL